MASAILWSYHKQDLKATILPVESEAAAIEPYVPRPTSVCSLHFPILISSNNGVAEVLSSAGGLARYLSK
jgi:hypothetical protein